MPVHPTLASILENWRRHGWVVMMGREPEPDDLIVPCPKREQFPAGRMRDKNYSRKRIIEDFAAVSLRHRRGHDLRRTMISLARSDGARKDLLEVCTHTPKGGRTAIDLYTTFEWPALCAEVGKLKVDPRGVRTEAVPRPEEAARPELAASSDPEHQDVAAAKREPWHAASVVTGSEDRELPGDEPILT